MSTYSTSQMWKARVNPWAKVGLLALSECSAGADDDEMSTFMFEQTAALARLTGYNLDETEDFLAVVLALSRTEAGWGAGSGVSYWNSDTITRAERAWPL